MVDPADAPRAKRARPSGGAAAAPHARGVELVSESAAARADSAAGSSMPLDRTDSSGRGVVDGGGGETAAAAAAAAPPPPPPPQQQQQPPAAKAGPAAVLARLQGEALAAPPRRPRPAGDAREPDAEPEPPAKRQRLARRAKPPPPLSRDDLRVTDRLSGPPRLDDADGHYVFVVGENLTPRFKVMRKFGEGTFGRVVECWDRRRGGYVAVKVVRAVQKYRDAAMAELEVLCTLGAADPGQRRHCVRLLEWFDYRGHICMVFERLGPSLYDVIRRNGYRPFPLGVALSFVRQLLESVEFMHELTLIHTDLKPENILLLSGDAAEGPAPPAAAPRPGGRPPPPGAPPRRLPARTAIRLIDFGSATFAADHHSAVVSTRHYRAPEIILGLGWGAPCDAWSLGCILVELLTGEALFQTHENLEHLAMMEAALGPLPPGVAARAAPERAAGLLRGGRLDWPRAAESRRSLKAVAKVRRVPELLAAEGDDSLRPHLAEVTRLVEGLLAYDPGARMTVAEALRSPLFAPGGPGAPGAVP